MTGELLLACVQTLTKLLVDSIFTTRTLGRKARWEDNLHTLTPVQSVGKLNFKRDDAFAPLGYGGINGSKLRQLIWLASEYRKGGGKAGLLTAASVLSPQLPMAAAVATHFDLPSVLIIGATNPKAAIRNEMVQMAAWFGAKFDFINVAYNPALQQRCNDLYRGDFANHFLLEYGITCDHRVHPPKEVEAFHRLGSEQVKNIPDDITDLIVPAGSCNSCTSILYGLARNPKPKLKNIYLIGIGPTKMGLVDERLRLMGKLTGVDTQVFNAKFKSDLPSFQNTPKAPYSLHYDDLHGRGLVRYHKRVPYAYKGISFHPTYEGKVMNHIVKNAPELLKSTTVFWIIGSKPSVGHMANAKKELGEFPKITPHTNLTMLNPKSPVKPGRGSKKEEKHLTFGMDFRRKGYRREVFLRFYGFHLQYRAHPGAVYYVFPYLADKQGWDMEQKLWFAYINGCSQNPVTTWCIFKRFPSLAKLKIPKLKEWFDTNYTKLAFDTDRRYSKKDFIIMVEDYQRNLNGASQVDFFKSLYGKTEQESFRRIWDKVINGFHLYGRLSTFSYLEYLRIMGIKINCDSLFLYDMEGSKSHRNGLCYVLGREDMDWHPQTNSGFKGYNKPVLDWLTEEGANLLAEAKARFRDEDFYQDVNYFTMESTFCTYKGWHRENRRYPNVYNDMFHDRIKLAEAKWEGKEDFSMFWDARKQYLPSCLRIEDCPRDVGVKSIKQNHYRNTGQPVMMDSVWPCFENSYNDATK